MTDKKYFHSNNDGDDDDKDPIEEEINNPLGL